MGDDRAAVETITEAYERTVAAGTAVIELRTELTWEIPPYPRRRSGGLLRPVGRGARAAGKLLLKATVGDLKHRRLSGEGVLDLKRRRFMLDYDSYAQLSANGTRWSGRSGRPIATLLPEEGELPIATWLVDLLGGLTSASRHGRELVRETSCEYYRATCDLARASARVPAGLAAPASGRFEDLLALPVEVWIDATHVRRLRFERENRIETLDVWDFGTDVESLDWSRLPTFRSPDEAHEIAEYEAGLTGPDT